MMSAARVVLLDVAALAPADWPRLAALLDDSERAQAARFHFAADRDAYIGAHALLRAMLSAQGDIAPTDWRFAAGAHGKPFLLNAQAPHRRFSLSHTHGYAAVALSDNADVGVDIEAPRPRAGDETHDDLALASRFFAPEETAFLRGRDGDARRDAFFAIWTLKEAVAKATGLGLTAPLDRFCVRLAPPRIAGDDGWSLAHWRVGAAHAACAAAAPAIRFDLAQTTAAAIASLTV